MSDIPLENLDFAKVGAMQQILLDIDFSFIGLLLYSFILFISLTQNSVFSLQGRGTFPCDISVLEIQQDLDWNPKVSTLNVWPLYICDDGAVVFYRLESKRMHPPPTEVIREFYFLMNLKMCLFLRTLRNSTEEPMELSEDERSELMKRESSRLLKTGHRVSYSPRKEKALKIYLDGGPTKDPGQD